MFLYVLWVKVRESDHRTIEYSGKKRFKSKMENHFISEKSKAQGSNSEVAWLFIPTFLVSNHFTSKGDIFSR